ncbi:MAG: hypothetical protein EA397_09505 [Deltaproteobacteria bacterium]|nr:MAG: hypothetical protein EA397_09505 [Deltaproteobacteria bacterium]
MRAPLLLVLLATSGCSETGLTLQPPRDAPAVHIEPGEPVTLDELTAVVRNQRETYTYVYTWLRDEVVEPQVTGPVVPAELTTKHEVWQVRVVPFNNDLEGPEARAQVVVLNSPPVAEAHWSVDPVTSRDPLEPVITVTDADDDEVTLGFQWRRDGLLMPYSEPYIPAEGTARGQVWEVTITPHDGDDRGELVVLTTEVGNAPPSADDVLLSPDPAFTDSLLTATPVDLDDFDNDPVTTRYEWFVDGSSVQEGSSDTLEGSHFLKHQVVHVVMTPNDGFDDGDPVQSADLPILNSPPTSPEITITPSVPDEGEELTCSILVESVDVDPGDEVTYTFSWFLDGAPFTSAIDGDLTSTVAGTEVIGEQVWTCRVVATDGEDDAPPVEVTVSTGDHCAPDPGHWSGGLGAPERPYLVSTADALDAVRTASHCHFQLTNDIDLDGRVWHPIPNLSGGIDGAGHAVFNLSIDRPSGERQGFIDELEGYIREIGFYDVFVRARRSVGAVVVTTTEGSGALISGVEVSGEVVGQRSMGGIVAGVRPGTRIEHSRFEGTLRSDTSGSDIGFLGGVAGGIGGEGYDLEFDGEFLISNTAWKVGGIVSQLSGTLDVCRTHGRIESNGSRVGGVVATATARAEISNCAVTATLRGTDITAGIIAEGWSVVAVSIIDSFASGEILGGTSSHPARGVVSFGAGGISATRTFWDTESTRQSIGGVAGAVGRTTAQMHDASTFAGWSSPPWLLSDGDYPTHDL